MIEQNAYFGSWLSSAVKTTVGWVAGGGNIPGDKASRSGQGPSEADVSAEVTKILNGQGTGSLQTSTPISGVPPQTALLIGGVGLLAILLLKRRDK